jgi:hypothetical protein
MRTATTAGNPFALMTDPAGVRQMIEKSESLRRLDHRKCHPLDRPVIRSISAELAAYDAKIDRTTIYLPPEEEEAALLVRSLAQPVN